VIATPYRCGFTNTREIRFHAVLGDDVREVSFTWERG
jgi:hypothetical protein